MSRRPNLPIAPAHDAAAERSQIDHSRLDDVAGHRVMRRFAVGTRGTLLLAHQTSRSQREIGRSRLLKVYHPHTPASSVDVELTALSSVVTPHVVRLIDVASVESGQPPCLVLEKLPGPALSAYLGQQNTLGAGQAVTILAPLCATLQALHDSGVTHGGIHLRRIVFDVDGAPVLTGFGRGMLRQPSDIARAAGSSPRGGRAEATESSRESAWRAAVLDDQRDLLAVVDEVLLHIVDAPPPAPLDVDALARAIGSGPSREFLPRLEQMLFTLAAPQVVSVAGSGSHGVAATKSRVAVESRALTPDRPTTSTSTTDFDWAQPVPSRPSIPVEHRLVTALRVLGASSSALETVSSVADAAARISARRRAVRESTAGEGGLPAQKTPKRWSRRPLLVGVSFAVAATTALLFVLPPANDEARAGAGDVDSTTVPVRDVASGEPTVVPSIDEAPSLLGVDPAEALRALGHTNDGCLASTEEQACRATVFQPEFLESQPVSEAPIVIDAADAIVTGSWGGSALVAARLNDQPASFLLMKGEAGWRVRDVFVSDR